MYRREVQYLKLYIISGNNNVKSYLNTTSILDITLSRALKFFGGDRFDFLSPNTHLFNLPHTMATTTTTETVTVQPMLMGCCPWAIFLKWLLVVLSILIFIIAIVVIVPAAKVGGVIPIIEIIASSLAMILAIMIIAAIFIPSLKLMVINYYTSIVILILKIITFVLTLIYYLLMSKEEDKDNSLSMFIASLIALLIHMALPFVIRAYISTVMDPNRTLHGVFDIMICRPCRSGGDGNTAENTSTTATAASANSKKLAKPKK